MHRSVSTQAVEAGEVKTRDIPKNAEYRIDRVKRRGKGDELDDLFKRASYLCKKATKSYGDRQRGFGTSRG